MCTKYLTTLIGGSTKRAPRMLGMADGARGRAAFMALPLGGMLRTSSGARRDGRAIRRN